MPFKLCSWICALLIGAAPVSAASTNEAAAEVVGEVTFLTGACLSRHSSAEVGAPELSNRGYTGKKKKKWFSYTRTLQHRQAVLSKPKVTYYHFRNPPKICLFGFLHLANGAAEGLEEIAYREIKRYGYKMIGPSRRLSHINLAEAFFSKGGKKIRVVLSQANGFISLAIDRAE